MNDNVELHDDEMEIVDEAKVDPDAGTEQQSVSATDKAAGSGKKAPARKGDKSNSQPMQKMPGNKAGMINAMYNKMEKMDLSNLQAMYSKMESVDWDAEEIEDVLENVEVDFSEDLNALVESEATLSDEFKTKTALIFEAALKSKLSQEVNRLEEQYANLFEEEITSQKNELVEKVDSYLNYVVENWMEENRVAIESGLRTEIAEDFMNNLRDLFTESYIVVPETKVDLVDGLAEEVAELESALDKSTASRIEMAEQLESLQREIIISEHADGLAETQVEKLRSLVESLDFEDAESFDEKVAVVKESYFEKNTVSAEEVIQESDEEGSVVETSDSMNAYLSAIRKSNK